MIDGVGNKTDFCLKCGRVRSMFMFSLLLLYDCWKLNFRLNKDKSAFPMLIKEQLFRSAIVIVLLRRHSRVFANHGHDSSIRSNSRPVVDRINGPSQYLIGLAPAKALVM